MKILVASCDKNSDLFDAFYYCIEKYWPNHPEIVYSTETIVNSHYKTICNNLPVDKWTKRIRETLKKIDDKHIILMCDDCFIRSKVDNDLLEKYLTDKVAFINYEKSFDNNDILINEDIKKRPLKGNYKISLMCGLWDKNKLIDLLDYDASPWEFELNNYTKNYDYLISTKYVIDFGHYQMGDLWGLWRGQWMRELESFFNKEGISIDYSRRDFYD